MDIQTLFLQVFIYLCAALVAILLRKKLGVVGLKTIQPLS